MGLGKSFNFCATPVLLLLLFCFVLFLKPKILLPPPFGFQTFSPFPKVLSNHFYQSISQQVSLDSSSWIDLFSCSLGGNLFCQTFDKPLLLTLVKYILQTFVKCLSKMFARWLSLSWIFFILLHANLCFKCHERLSYRTLSLLRCRSTSWKKVQPHCISYSWHTNVMPWSVV